VTDVLFYHLTSTPLEATLPSLVERSLARGWRVHVQGTDAARLTQFDQLLWSYAKEGFLPHGIDGDGNETEQPVLLSTHAEAKNTAQLLMLIDGARHEPSNFSNFERVCVFFDGNEATALNQARADWKAVKAADLEAKYWAQEGGKWVQKQ